MVLILMGFKGCFNALATDLGYSRVSHRPPPDPDSTGPTNLLRWISPFVSSTTLRLGLLLSFVSPTNGLDHQLSHIATALTWLRWCFSTWWLIVRPVIVTHVVSILRSLEYIAINYWHMLFVWLSFALICHAFSRLQSLLQTGIKYPALQFGPVSFVCGYFFLWWLTQYQALLVSVNSPSLWWFFALQPVPIYLWLFRGTINAGSYWLEFILSACMVPRRHSPPMTEVCGYGSWYIPPRRRRRRGESPIRLMRLRCSFHIHSVSSGITLCAGTFLQGASDAVSRLVAFSIECVHSMLDKLATLWDPVCLILRRIASAAYLLWALMVLLDLLVPPWYSCIGVSAAYHILRSVTPVPPESPIIWISRPKYHPDEALDQVKTRPCIAHDTTTSVLTLDDPFSRFTARCWALFTPPPEVSPFLVPSVVPIPRAELRPPNVDPTRQYIHLTDPLMNHTPFSPGTDATMDFEALLEDDYNWWPPDIDDLSDDLLFGRFELGEKLFSLYDAGYRFTFDLDFEPISEASGPTWRARRTLHHQQLKSSRPAPSPVIPPPVPSINVFTTQFLCHFNPAVSARPFIPKQEHIPGSLPTVATIDPPAPTVVRILLNYIFNVKLPHEPLIVDTGASVCITPYASDFKDGTYRPSSMKIRDLSNITSAAGEGTIQWPVTDESGVTFMLEVPGVHLESATVRLLSPQVLIRSAACTMTMDDQGLSFQFRSGSTIKAPVNNQTNLPQIPLSDAPALTPSTFGFDTFSFEAELLSDWNASINEHKAFMTILRSDNTNLRASQKELLLWHQRLSHYNLQAIRSLLLPRNRLESDLPDHPALHTDRILPTKHDATARVDTATVKCGPCLMAKARRRNPGCKTPRSDIPPGSALRRNDIIPGQRISCDHFICSDRGRRLDTFGRSTNTRGYVGGALYVDHASGKIFHYPQTDLTAATTIRGKQIVEKAAARAGFKVQAYHTDNGIFASSEFRNHCTAQEQDLTFSGAHAHHQNGIAERSIGTISCCARANLIHLMLCWPDRANINLWAFAINYAVWVYNRLPSNMLGGLSPNEIWSGNRADHHELRRAHVFGCPVYVLDPKLADGDSIPKWNHRAHMGMFLGFSHEHSSLVPLVLNLSTGHVSPQYHVIFDDNFETVPSLNPNASDIDDKFAALFESSREFYLHQISEEDDFKAPPYVPLRLQREMLRIQRETLWLQRETITLQREMLQLQRETSLISSLTLPTCLAGHGPPEIDLPPTQQPLSLLPHPSL